MRPVEMTGIVNRTTDFAQVRQNEEQKPVAEQYTSGSDLIKNVEKNSENLVIYYIVDIFTNVFRSIPFYNPAYLSDSFTRALVGTAIGVKGAVVPLIFGAVSVFYKTG